MYSFPIYILLFTSSVVAHCSRSYTVKSGDGCDTISAVHQSSTYQLAYSNQGSINDCCSNLHIGQTICLALKTQPDCTATHIVKDADTCETLATLYHTNTTMIMSNNPQLDQTCSIYTGQVLCVAPTLQASPIPTSSKWVAPHPCQDDKDSSVYTPAADNAPAAPLYVSGATVVGGNDYPHATTGTPQTTTTSSGHDTGTVNTQSVEDNLATPASSNNGTNSRDDDGSDNCEDDDPLVLNPDSSSGDDDDCDEDDHVGGDDDAEGDCDDDDPQDDGQDGGDDDCEDDEVGDQ